MAEMKFCERFSCLKGVLLVMFLTGFNVAIPSAVIPGYQQEVFGNNAFVITGAFAAAKGVLGFIYVPLLGSFTDIYGRKNALVVILALSVIPYSAMLVGNFWAYSVANTFLGLYDAVMTIMLTMSADRICGPSTSVRTEAFAMVLSAFFFGVSTGPFLGAFLTTTQTFITCAGVQLFNACISWKLFTDDRTGQRPLSAATGEADAAGNNKDGEVEGPRYSVGKCPVAHVSAPRTESMKAEPQVVDAAAVQQEQKEEEEKPKAAADVPREEGQQTTTVDEDEEANDNDALISRDTTDRPARVSRCVWKRVFEALRNSGDLRLVAMVVFWNSLAENVFDKLLLLYLQETLNFNSTEQAIVIAILGVGALLGLLVATPLLKAKIGIKNTLFVGLIVNGIVALFYAFAQAHWIIMVGTGLSIFGMTVFPCAIALAIKSVPEEAVGIAQGVATASRMIASGISPLAFGEIFNITQGTVFPGTAFVCATACTIVSCAFLKFVKA